MADRDHFPNQNHKLFESRISGEIAYIYFTEESLLLSTSLQAMEQLTGYLNHLSDQSGIKVIALIAPKQGINREEYQKFIKSMYQCKFDDLSAHRICNLTDQLIMQLINSNQIVISAFRGRVSWHFLNLGLACNCCLAAEGAVFQRASEGLGILPKGGGPYFLSKILGIKKATNLLMEGSDISARMALEYGLIDQVAPDEQFEESIEHFCTRIARHSSAFLKSLKKLNGFLYHDLAEYLKLENRLFINSIGGCRNRESWAFEA
jgi:2-(1,2-epoxy-1,2-dihydrophenyl)acetyl-CoA isomerase